MANKIELGLALAVTFSAVACEPEKPNLDSNLQSYYPEANNLLLKQNGSFDTGKRKVSWYNFSDLKIDETETKRTYDFISELTADGLVLQSDSSLFKIAPREEDIVLIVVPPTAPDPSWGHAQNGGMTMINPEEPAISFITAESDSPTNPYFNNQADNTSLSIFVEACQGLVEGRTESNELDMASQEQFCNSLAVVLALKGLGFNYQEYLDYMDVLISQFDNFSFDEEAWNNFPTIPSMVE